VQRVYYIQAYEPEYYHGLRPDRMFLRTLSTLSYFLPCRRIANAPIYLRYKLLRSDRWVPPGLDFRHFHADRLTPPLEEDTVWLGCIGRKEAAKGTRYVVDAYLQLREAGIPVQLRVAYGNVPAHIGAHYDVVTPGNDAELAAFYRSVDILIAPGTVQLGAVHYPVIEAMACGTPVITTGYLPATVDNAWIVPVKDATAIANAVQTILHQRQEARRRAEQAHLDVQRFVWPALAKEMLDAMTGA
jgi:glycosyltransferase involved in cell wall biosynthesis